MRRSRSRLGLAPDSSARWLFHRRSRLATRLRRIRNKRLWPELVAQYRLLRRPRKVRIHGVDLAIDRAWGPTILSFIYRGEYEVDEARVLSDTLRPDDRLLEIGAGIGVITTVACQRLGGDRVTALEANPALVPVAAATARRNGFDPEIVNAVVGDTAEPRQFYVHREFWLSSLVPGRGRTQVTVPGRRFEDELARVGATYLMLDIEGGEIELLDRTLPKDVRAVCLETHPFAVGPAAVNRLVTGLIAQGLLLDSEHSRGRTLCFTREGG